jgi:hypothetical protein
MASKRVGVEVALLSFFFFSDSAHTAYPTPLPNSEKPESQAVWGVR